jgi:GR25 family glycosyltransferase involved in LPS biosynthesis
MKSFVITIQDNEKSQAAADRCIQSGKHFKLDISKFYAFTPKSNPIKIAETERIPIRGFREVWSRYENCIAAFLSHYTLWKTCWQINQEIQIFEHDAVVTQPIPDFINYKACISLGAPSYGKFNIPSKIGVNKLTSKAYFPGAHAYRLKPSFAKELIDASKKFAMPTDVFLDIRRFPNLEEYYPWPVEARDNFTTIQTVDGCLAKHKYGPGYKII